MSATEDDYRWFVASDPNLDDEDTVVSPLPGVPTPMAPVRTEEIRIDVVEDDDADLPPLLALHSLRALPPPPVARTKTPPIPDTKFSQLNTIIGVMREVMAERVAPIPDVEIDAIEWHLRERIAKL